MGHRVYICAKNNIMFSILHLLIYYMYFFLIYKKKTYYIIKNIRNWKIIKEFEVKVEWSNRGYISRWYKINRIADGQCRKHSFHWLPLRFCWIEIKWRYPEWNHTCFQFYSYHICKAHSLPSLLNSPYWGIDPEQLSDDLRV